MSTSESASKNQTERLTTIAQELRRRIWRCILLKRGTPQELVDKTDDTLKPEVVPELDVPPNKLSAAIEEGSRWTESIESDPASAIVQRTYIGRLLADSNIRARDVDDALRQVRQELRDLRTKVGGQGD